MIDVDEVAAAFEQGFVVVDATGEVRWGARMYEISGEPRPLAVGEWVAHHVNNMLMVVARGLPRRGPFRCGHGGHRRRGG